MRREGAEERGWRSEGQGNTRGATGNDRATGRERRHPAPMIPRPSSEPRPLDGACNKQRLRHRTDAINSLGKSIWEGSRPRRALVLRKQASRAVGSWKRGGGSRAASFCAWFAREFPSPRMGITQPRIQPPRIMVAVAIRCHRAWQTQPASCQGIKEIRGGPRFLFLSARMVPAAALTPPGGTFFASDLPCDLSTTSVLICRRRWRRA